MNAAARLVHQNALSRHLVLTQILTRGQIGVLILTLTILMSALGIIYVTHTNRILYATYQRNLSEQDKLHMQNSQLLLEQSAWLVPSRVQHIAETKLGMVNPDHESVVIIRE